MAEQFPADPRIPLSRSRKSAAKSPATMARKPLKTKKSWLSAYSGGMYTGQQDEASVDKEIRRVGYDPNTLKPAKKADWDRK